MTKTEQLEELFKKWQEEHKSEKFESKEEYFKYHKKHPGDAGYIPKENFIYDGILFENEYNDSACKILFIGKESNECYTDRENDEHIYLNDENFWVKNRVKNEDEAAGAFVLGLAKIANAIATNDFCNPNSDLSILHNVAFINLNKRGGYKYCVRETLIGYVKKYNKQIKAQIDIIKPDIIVCCGKDTYNMVTNYKLAENRTVVYSYHPSYRRSDIYKLSFLESQIKQIRNNNHVSE